MDPAPLALLWDVDGTLAETELQGHRLAFNRAFAEADLPWRWDEATYLELLAVSGGRERLAGWLTRVEGTAPSPGRLDALVASKADRIADVFSPARARAQRQLPQRIRHWLAEA